MKSVYKLAIRGGVTDLLEARPEIPNSIAYPTIEAENIVAKL